MTLKAAKIEGEYKFGALFNARGDRLLLSPADDADDAAELDIATSGWGEVETADENGEYILEDGDGNVWAVIADANFGLRWAGISPRWVLRIYGDWGRGDLITELVNCGDDLFDAFVRGEDALPETAEE